MTNLIPNWRELTEEQRGYLCAERKDASSMVNKNKKIKKMVPTKKFYNNSVNLPEYLRRKKKCVENFLFRFETNYIHSSILTKKGCQMIKNFQTRKVQI
jgi:hypothetical protein